MSLIVWTMAGVALWHFTIFVPDRFAGGIIGALLAAWAGAVASGIVFDGMRMSDQNPPGLHQVLTSLPGALLGLAACWLFGRHPSPEPEGAPT